MKPQNLNVVGPSGAAFLLHRPAYESVEIDRPEGTVLVRANTAYVVAVLRTVVHGAELRDTAWRVVQEGLDIHAAMYGQALATTRGGHEHILWSNLRDAYSLTIVDTLDSRWDMSARVSVATADGAQAAPDPIPHHSALRFYRLSQFSEDLFDAFRNAYLALECLVSDVSPKGRSESELDWLIRVLSGPLSREIPDGIDIVPAIETIYRLGRLPLFHAKTGRCFYLPQGEERAVVQATFATLQLLVSYILNTRVSKRLPRGWSQMSRALMDSRAAVGLKADELVFHLGSESESARSVLEIVEEPRRFSNYWARTSIAPPKLLGAVDSVSLHLKGAEMSRIKLAEAVSLEGVDTVHLEISVLDTNVRAPLPLHPA